MVPNGQKKRNVRNSSKCLSVLIKIFPCGKFKKFKTNKALLTIVIGLKNILRSVQFSCSVVSDSLWPHELQHARPPCLSPTTRVHSNSRPSSRWCHPAISSSVILVSSCPQSLPASESFRWNLVKSVLDKEDRIVPVYSPFLNFFICSFSVWCARSTMSYDCGL